MENAFSGQSERQFMTEAEMDAVALENDAAKSAVDDLNQKLAEVVLLTPEEAATFAVEIHTLRNKLKSIDKLDRDHLTEAYRQPIKDNLYSARKTLGRMLTEASERKTLTPEEATGFAKAQEVLANVYRA